MLRSVKSVRSVARGTHIRWMGIDNKNSRHIRELQLQTQELRDINIELNNIHQEMTKTNHITENTKTNADIVTEGLFGFIGGCTVIALGSILYSEIID